MQKTHRNRRFIASAATLLVAALAGCRSDGGGKQVNYEFLRPTEWFDSSSDASADESDPETGVSGKTRGDISVPPVPPAIESSSSPPPPVGSGKAYYSVRRTGSRNLLGGHLPWSGGSDESADSDGANEPRLRPVPRSYD